MNNEPLTSNNVELGQMLFGNSTGSFQCPDFVEALFASIFDEIERAYWNKNQEEWDRFSKPFPLIDVRPYYWGDCTCGWADMSFDEPHEPTCYQSLVDKELAEQYKFKADEDGYLEAPRKMSYKKADAIKDAVRKKYCKQFDLSFPAGSAVHCTCVHDKHAEEWFDKNKKGEFGHADNCEVQLPNFAYKGVELRWYKHFGRSMSVNVSMSEKEWRKWYDDCIQYVRGQEPKY